MASDFHIVPDTFSDRWTVIRDGRRLSQHRTQERAVSTARSMARRLRVDVVTHGRDGQIRSKDSYGNEGPGRDTEH